MRKMNKQAVKDAHPLRKDDYPLTKPRIVSVTCRKGGVGKSSTVSLLGAKAAIAGYRTAIVDFDTQYNSTVMALQTNIKNMSSPAIIEQTIADLKATKIVTARDFLLGIEWGERGFLRIDMSGRYGEQAEELVVIPGEANLYYFNEKEVIQPEDAYQNLYDSIRNLIEDESLDIVFIDTPPGDDVGNRASYAVSTDVIIPHKTDEDDHYGAIRAWQDLVGYNTRKEELGHPKINFLGFLPSFVNPFSNGANAHLEYQNKWVADGIPHFKSFYWVLQGLPKSRTMTVYPWDMPGTQARNSATNTINEIFDEFMQKLVDSEAQIEDFIAEDDFQAPEQLPGLTIG